MANDPRRILDVALLQLTASDTFTLRDACQSVSIIGKFGGGKTSGSINRQINTNPALFSADRRPPVRDHDYGIDR